MWPLLLGLLGFMGIWPTALSMDALERSQLREEARDMFYHAYRAYKVNLRHGLKSLEKSTETCTACAGTMVLEMAALSRLSGEPIFENKAHRAMDVLWQMRHRSSDLMGTVLNVHSGDWVRRDSGVGAGIDSYYEYCLKAYVLLGEEKYLGRFNRHYDAVMKYISQGPLLLDVLMHRPHTNSRNFMDALLAFWPGLQVLKGDIKPAVETHEMLYQIIQRHNLLPEAFTTDFQVHWGQHPLRPEFLESTYFLYRATQDPYYLQVGKHALMALQKYSRVPCGYAAIKDVRTTAHEDRMDSFVLAETLKYLYLLFTEPSNLVLDLDDFLFTTEAHLLPLTLAKSRNSSVFLSGTCDEDPRICPSTLHLFPESVRKPLKNMVNGMCPRRSHRRKLHAVQFQIGNPEHMKAVHDMGIAIITLPDGRLQLLHTLANARSATDAEEGLQFMQEMIELSKSQAQTPDSTPLSVSYQVGASAHAPAQRVMLTAGPAHFGRELKGADRVSAKVALVEPLRVCSPIEEPKKLKGRIAVMERGDCMFIEKARRVESAGAVGAIVLDNTGGSSSSISSMFAMSGDGTNDVKIPVVFLFQLDALRLLQAVSMDPELEVILQDSRSANHESLLADNTDVMDARLLGSILDKLKGSVQDFLMNQQNHLDVKDDISSKEDRIRTNRGRSRKFDSDGSNEETAITSISHEPKDEL
ncbi:ER degradation-enhancing alpha-mannosidase-like protein 3 isoform X2 [Neocloeon triangulifer]|uniref:ER degradation-enhancing alpha-mannosidase-like protein 3 isoform X2 n=1 Tax=Neocloeon triangulifer TaxID=2078957 RepID=UPI00286F9289|nr:ER degradation-enhancing alpha-mannosidase-like protein 3 isoform X2 [Neocloeon triangulifer]